MGTGIDPNMQVHVVHIIRTIGTPRTAPSDWNSSMNILWHCKQMMGHKSPFCCCLHESGAGRVPQNLNHKHVFPGHWSLFAESRLRWQGKGCECSGAAEPSPKGSHNLGEGVSFGVLAALPSAGLQERGARTSWPRRKLKTEKGLQLIQAWRFRA